MFRPETRSRMLGNLAESGESGRILAPSGTLPSDKGRLGSSGPVLAGSAAGIFVFVLYLRTLSPSVLYLQDRSCSTR